MIRKIRKAIVAIAIAALMIAPFVGKSAATASPALRPAFADADLSAEERTLSSFVDDLAQYDKQCRESSKKAQLTRVEFAALQRQSDALKGRVSGVQNALREIVRKLKAANQWENLNQLVLTKLPNARSLVDQELLDSKRVLEEASLNLSSDANEISSPLDTLRPKVSAAERNGFQGESNLAALAVRVAYQPAAPAMFKVGFACRLTWLKEGVVGAVTGKQNSTHLNNQLKCHCSGIQSACDAL